MKYSSAGAFRQALETRLNSASRESGGSLVRLRKGVVFDRLLARLLITNTENWVLEGGFALGAGGQRYRLAPPARSGRGCRCLDLDLDGDRIHLGGWVSGALMDPLDRVSAGCL